jgi:hypothetical protein
MDPLLQYKLGVGLFASQTTAGGGGGATGRQETPFYVKSGKTSAEIIEEAKATMAIKAAAEDISLRAAVRTVDTKRPFTPRQTDRRLYYGSTNHVARPPSSFRLLPLPEEELCRPVTAPRLTSGGGSCRGSPGGVNGHDNYYSYGEGENRLPVILPHINLTMPVQQQPRKSPKETRRSQFRASSLCDVLEVSEQTEPGLEDKRLPAQPKSGKGASRSAAARGRKASGTTTITVRDDDAVASSNLLQELDTGSWPTAAAREKRMPVRAKSMDYGKQHGEETQPARRVESSGEMSPVGGLLAGLKDPQQLDKEATMAGLESLYTFIAADANSSRPKAALAKHKSDIIKTLCLYVDTESPRVLILVVQILLAMGVRKQNLATAYKLTYKVARDADNDVHFLANENVLELLVNSIGGACPTLDAEALVYGYGGLKFLTMNMKTRERLKAKSVEHKVCS